MGAGLAKNKLSPEPQKRTPRGGVISVAPSPTPLSSSGSSGRPDRDAPEDEFLEKIANNYMKRDRKSFHTGGTTYAGVDLRLEVDCVDTPATLEVWQLFVMHTLYNHTHSTLTLCSLRPHFSMRG
jgi:hypothetical protein